VQLDDAAASRLDRLLDGATPAAESPAANGDADDAIVVRLHSLARRPAPTREFVRRLREDLMTAPGAASASTAYPQADLLTDAAPEEYVGPDARSFRRWVPPLELAAAAALILVVVSVSLRGQGGDPEERRLASLQPSATPPAATGVVPVGIAIPRIDVAAPIENGAVQDGALLKPTGPLFVAWYDELGGIAPGSSPVLFGHYDYWDVGPAVFARLDELAAGDRIELFGADGTLYGYDVETARTVPANADATDLAALLAPSSEQRLTLITERPGTWDEARQDYADRLVLTARLTRHVQPRVPGQLDYPSFALESNIVFDIDGTPTPHDAG